MGRHRFGDPPKGAVRLYKAVISSDGYDKGGAYWGIGDPLYFAYACNERGETVYQSFARAKTRAEAAQKLGLTADHLIRPC